MKNSDAFRLSLKLLACFALMACGSAQATITCTLTSNGFSSFYDPVSPTQNVTSASVTITCTRSNKNDSTRRTFTITANNGLNATGTQNRARLSGVNYINYDIHSNSTCSSPWQGNTTLGGTVNFTSNNDYVQSQIVNFWGCIPAGQNVAAGTYTDTVTMTPMNRRGTSSIGSTATFPVTISTTSSCSISTPPGNVTFNYSSFQAGPASASTSFAATCTASLPYTMALDATGGTLLGLNYALSLSASSATGTGVAQPYTVNGSIAAGQAGTCSGATCSATAPRTLTISY